MRLFIVIAVLLVVGFVLAGIIRAAGLLWIDWRAQRREQERRQFLEAHRMRARANRPPRRRPVPTPDTFMEKEDL